jgi:hypothetical protein
VAGAIEQGHHDPGLRSQSPWQPAGAARSAELAESLLQVVGVHYRDDLPIAPSAMKNGSPNGTMLDESSK